MMQLARLPVRPAFRDPDLLPSITSRSSTIERADTAISATSAPRPSSRPHN